MTQHELSTDNSHAPVRRRRWLWLAGGMFVMATCAALKVWWGAAPANAAAPAAQPQKNQPPANVAPAEQKQQFVAVVNGEKVTRNDLAREALWHYGDEVLDSLMNKHLIAQHCQMKNVQVTKDEVAAEIDRMAERFGVATDQWLKMLKEERNITPSQYARDIIWPTVALRKLAAARLEVSEAEVQTAYETQFGPAVQTRIIVLDKLEDARIVHAKALANPAEFGNLAKESSVDSNSASAKGLIQPIRKHMGDPNLERVAFGLRPGEISDIIAIDKQFVILKCESHVPAREVPMEQVRKVLTEACRDRKLRQVAGDVFEQLKRESRVENVYGDPAKRQQHPGIAAIINGQQITVADLANECVERHATEVIEGMINRKLLEQACKQKNLVVTEQDLNDEIVRAAVSMGRTKPDGSPDVDAWIKDVLAEQKTTFEIYRHDAVWPSVALKKLVGGRVEVTPEDLRKGYEANFGPRVKCRAIVFNHLRKAQEVWEMARSKQDLPFDQRLYHFGNLAEEYSIEASSRALRGEVPPIQRHGAQPLIEKEAFNLKPGELSHVIVVGDKCVVLFCEGFTTPTNVEFEAVKQQIHDDVHEKKLRIAMAQEFTRLQDTATVDNYIAGTTQSPKNGKSLSELGPEGAAPAGPQTATRPNVPPQAGVPVRR
jgi:parvulin-like peptidyl-prolyl isomerase